MRAKPFSLALFFGRLLHKRLIDSNAPAGHHQAFQAMDETTLLAHWIKNLSESTLTPSVSVKELRLLESQAQFNHAVEHAKREGLLPKEMGQNQASLRFQVFKINTLSWYAYRPQPYPGRLTVFRASETLTEANQKQTQGWEELATGGVEMHTIVSDHFSIIKTQTLAKLLKTSLAHQG